MLKAIDFFGLWVSWVSFAVNVDPGGSLCCYIFANQENWDQRSWEEQDQMGEWHILEQMRFQNDCLFLANL
jgi:hypothetical protein